AELGLQERRTRQGGRRQGPQAFRTAHEETDGAGAGTPREVPEEDRPAGRVPRARRRGGLHAAGLRGTGEGAGGGEAVGSVPRRPRPRQAADLRAERLLPLRGHLPAQPRRVAGAGESEAGRARIEYGGPEPRAARDRVERRVEGATQ